MTYMQHTISKNVPAIIAASASSSSAVLGGLVGLPLFIIGINREISIVSVIDNTWRSYIIVAAVFFLASGTAAGIGIGTGIAACRRSKHLNGRGLSLGTLAIVFGVLGTLAAGLLVLGCVLELISSGMA